jgi:putative tryptophan/tyrosine transport system substrate-binding protein
VIRRREFIVGVGAAATPVLWPLAAHAQQPSMPLIGFLDSSSPEAYEQAVSQFKRGLRDAGYIEGQNVAIEFRWGRGQISTLPQLASDLVRLQVAVIVVAGGAASQLAAKSATSTIPIVMMGGTDPIKSGLVDSLSWPGGNITGVTFIIGALDGKRLDLLLQLAPEVTTVGYLVGHRTDNDETVQGFGELFTAAHARERQIIVQECRQVSDLEKAFATMIERQAGAVVVRAFPLAFNNRDKIVALAAHHKMPAIYAQSQYVDEGGLMSYGAAGTARQVAIRYVARILKGAKPADLPIERPHEFRLVINLKTANALGLKIPPLLFAQANRVIE